MGNTGLTSRRAGKFTNAVAESHCDQLLRPGKEEHGSKQYVAEVMNEQEIESKKTLPTENDPG